MTLLDYLKRALVWDEADYSDMPDYKEICNRLGVDPEEDPELAKDAIEEALALMDLGDDLSGIDLGPPDNDDGGPGEGIH